MRDKIGGYPYETESEDGKLILRFYVKAENAMNPDSVKMTLRLTKEDIKKLSKL